jgi:hypothetical protein
MRSLTFEHSRSGRITGKPEHSGRCDDPLSVLPTMVKQHPRPSSAWKTELAANLWPQNPHIGERASPKITIFGQFMVVGLANL